MAFFGLHSRMPPRVATGVPASFKGIATGQKDLAKHIEGKAGGVPLDPIGFGVGALTFYTVPKKILKGIWGYIKFDSFDGADRPNKFTLRGCINFTGDYPPELVEARKKLK